MKLRTSLYALGLAAAAVLTHMAPAAAETVRFATEGNLAPFEYVDANGELQGFDVDIAHALCEQMQVTCEVVAQDWDGLIPGLKVHKFDAIIASMSITPERQRVVDFTQRYYSNVLAFVAPKADTLDRDNLKGKVIGAQRATISAQILEDDYASQGVEVKLYDTQDNAYIDLANGRLDALLTDKYPAYDWLKAAQGQDFEFKGDDIDINDRIGIAVRQGDPLKERLNQALQGIIDNGTYAKINAKYFPFSIY